MFTNKQDMILAGGAGSNQVRLFDYHSGQVVSIIGNLPRAVLTIGKAQTSADFAFACADA